MIAIRSAVISLLLPIAALGAQESRSAELMGAKALAYAENAARSFPGQYDIQLSRPPSLPPMLTPGKVAFEAERMSKHEPIGRFFVVFRVTVDGVQAATARIELESTWAGTLYRAKNALSRKAIIAEDDLEPFEFEGIPIAGALKEVPEGMRLRQPMRVGKVLTQMDIEPIPLVNAMDKVRATLKNGPLQISCEATARSNGAMGDKVRLEMDGSKKIVYGIVTGPGEAAVMSIGHTNLALRNK
jgi:flagella basal body P-ring formation protein FlgA